MKKIFSVLLLGTALTFSTACKKDEKKDADKADKGDKGDKGAKGDDKAGDDKGGGDKGGGDAVSTGAAECDDLIKKTMCMYDKTPGTPPEAKKAFEDSVKAWQEALKNDATKQATIDACKMSLDAGKDGFAAVGC